MALLHAMIGIAPSALERAEAARQILAVDPFDERANHTLADALADLGAGGLAEATRQRFRSTLR